MDILFKLIFLNLMSITCIKECHALHQIKSVGIELFYQVVKENLLKMIGYFTMILYNKKSISYLSRLTNLNDNI